MIIYHLTSRSRWDAHRERGSYSTGTLEEAGFIHCSTEAQLLPVANAFFRDSPDPIVLWIETDLLEAPLRWETPDETDPFAAERFPHVYGPINPVAVVAVTQPVRGPDGRFTEF